MFCRKCGANINNNQKFCPNCGEPIVTAGNNSNGQTYRAPSTTGNNSAVKSIVVSILVVGVMICGVLLFTSGGSRRSSDGFSWGNSSSSFNFSKKDPIVGTWECDNVKFVMFEDGTIDYTEGFDTPLVCEGTWRREGSDYILKVKALGMAFQFDAYIDSDDYLVVEGAYYERVR